MADTNLNDIVGLIDSTRGEIICKDCLAEEERENIPDEETIKRDNIKTDDVYICDRCKKQL
ncbi:MAG: hypothetical protein JSU72_18485 [Deltaproteobacteria bacterium]|nr:MAG: hypothetical protein JSU72_18485 [Deltaproteobacteria bacterium]